MIEQNKNINMITSEINGSLKIINQITDTLQEYRKILINEPITVDISENEAKPKIE